MPALNSNFEKLTREYIFPIIEEKKAQLHQQCPTAEIINLGIGDIALPLAPSIVSAICKATEEMGKDSGLRGYAPSNGYLFLREAIAKAEFAHFGIGAEEIFISDGTNSDTVAIQELFSNSAVVGIMDPTYPAYADANLLSGKLVVAIPCLEEHGFCPQPPQTHCDLLYLCSPNNPTGTAMTRADLKQWVDYALEHEALLLFDHAYAAFVSSPQVPRSIFEIEGATSCAIEFRSFSKEAGFTGLRCAYAVIPKNLSGRLGDKKVPLCTLWNQRQAIKFNGVAYPIQRGAEAVYSPGGAKETQAQVKLYQQEAHRLRTGLEALGQTCYGGIDSPYIWWKTPQNLTSWAFFDLLLEQCQLIAIPGQGFGRCGEGFVRLSAFTTPDKVSQALHRITTMLSKLRTPSCALP